MEEDLLYQLALSKIKGIGPIYTKKLIDHFGSAKAIFRADSEDLTRIGNIGLKRAAAITRFTAFRLLEKEMAFLTKYAIRPLFITDNQYPQRLLNCQDAPVLLFYKGNADLNASRIIAIIGTRSPTEYGKSATEHLVKELSSSGVLIVSGLAYGIDAVAHRAALKNQLSTIGILGHGLDRIYPPEHARLAKEMLKQGGLLTSFSSGTDTETYHFPIRNRVVAGLCDALIVAETRLRGGSMLTIQNALTYKKKIFAIPGRISDVRSAGCNALIRKNKATLLTGAGTLKEEMKWNLPNTKQPAAQASLFPSPGELAKLTDDEKTVFRYLKEKGNQYIDDISAATGLRFGKLALPLLALQLKGFVLGRPGNMYSIRE